LIDAVMRMPFRRLGSVVVCCTVWAGTPAIGEVQTQHAVDTSARLLWFEPLWHFRARTTPQGGGIAQIRTGPILHFELHERVTLLTGYYFTREKEERTWLTVHRPFGGGEFVVWNRGIELDFRTLVERFVAHREPDYTRFRNRLRVSPAARTAPYLGIEVFTDREIWRKMRYSGGLRVSLRGEMILDIGYFFEEGRPGIGNKHMVGTSIHWRNKNVRIDPDL
jgi:hypothetical protein